MIALALVSLASLLTTALAGAPKEYHPQYCEAEFGESSKGFNFLVFKYPTVSPIGYDIEHFSLKGYYLAGDFVTAGANNVALYFNSTDPDAQYDGVKSLYSMEPFTFVQYGLLTAPATGMYKYEAWASNGAGIQIGSSGDFCADLNSDGTTKEVIPITDNMKLPATGSFYLEKGRVYPIRILLWHHSGPVVFRWDVTDPQGNAIDIKDYVRQEPEVCEPLQS